MKVKLRRSENITSWNKDIEDFNYSLFSTPEWLESLKDELKAPVYIDFVNEANTVAKIAGFSIRTNSKFKQKLYFYAGPAVHKDIEPGVAQNCMLELLRYAKSEKYNRVVLYAYDYVNLYQTSHLYKFNTRNEYIIDLTPDIKVINKNISENVKRLKRKAEKNGFSFKSDHSKSLIDKMIQLIDATKEVRLEKGYVDYDPYYFPLLEKGNLYQLLENKAIGIFYVEKNNVIHSIISVLVRSNKSYAIFIGSDKVGYDMGLPSYMYYELIHYLKAHNYHYLNLGGIPEDKTHKGLVMFKLKLGAKPVSSLYGNTNFLLYPYKLANPICELIRLLPENKLISAIKKKLV